VALVARIESGEGIGGPGIHRGRWMRGSVGMRLRTLSLAKKTGIPEGELEEFRLSVTDKERTAINSATMDRVKREREGV
jgi:hypothetical protein